MSPQIDNSRGGRARAKRAKPRRPPKRRYTPPPSRSDAAQRSPGERTPPRAKPVVPAVPPNIFGGPAFSKQQRQAAQKVSRARKRLPEPPLPAVPTLRHPTRKQQRAAAKLVQAAIVHLAGSRDVRRQNQVVDMLMSDPRSLRRLAPVNRAAAAKLERQDAALARRAGFLGTRAQRAQIGRALALRDTVAPASDRRKRVGFGPASITINPAAIRAAVAGATSLDQGDLGPREFARNAAGDVVALGTAPFVGGYEVGAAGWEALAHGDLDRAERLATGAWEGVKASVPGRLASGDLEGAAEAFREHPVFSALDVAGAAGVAGRTAGALTRAAGSQASRQGARGVLARAGSTTRPPLALTDDPAAALVERSYSKDLTRKAVQVLEDHALEPLRREDGSVVTVRQRGREVPVLKAPAAVRERMQAREGDFAASRHNSVERMVRDQAAHEMRVRGIRGAAARDLVAMVVEGTITTARHFDADLRAHAKRLRAEIRRHERGEPVYRHTGELKAARDRLALVEKVLDTPRALGQREKIVAAGEEIGRKLNAAEKEAIRLGLLHPARSRRSRLIPAAVEHLQARHFAPHELADADLTPEAARHGSIRRANGQFLPNEEIEDFLRQRGRDPETVAYLPHRLDVRGRRAFHTQFRPGTRPMMDKSEGRTGAAYRKGATEASTDLIRDHGVRQATQIAKAQQLDKLVHEQGRKLPDGRYFTARQALETAERLEADSGERWVPMRALAARLDPETQRMIRDELQGPAGMDSLGLRLLNDRIVRAADEPGKARARNVVLVPAAIVEQLQRHLRPAGALQKFFQAINRPFRFAVLAQPRWLAGNFVEPFIVRLTTTGSGVNVLGLGVDVAAAQRLLRRMDRSPDAKVRAAATELRAQHLGGLFIGGRGAGVRRGLEDFPAADRAYGQLVAKLPVVAQGIDLVRLAGHALMAPGGAYFRLNRGIETVAQRAALGRDVRRDLQQFTGSWKATLRLQAKALDEVAEGLVNTPTQRRFLRSQHELLGKYEGYPPWLRELIQGPMPFLPWALNAARFVYWTMPAHRTIQTALLVKINDVVAKDWEEVHRNVPPGSLKLAIPTKKGGWVDVARYTPWGLPAEGDLLESGVRQIAPTFSGALEAVRGRDPFGRALAIDPSENEGESEPNGLQRAGIGAYGLAEALVPYLSQLRRLREGGGTAYAGSTLLDPDTKPGTKRMSGLRRTFDPLRPTYLGAAPEAGTAAPLAPSDDPIDRALEQIAIDESVSAAQDAAIDEALRQLAP